MEQHKYILEPYNGMNSRYRCPSCQKQEKTFSRYIDTETGEQIHPSVGRCNRESNCGYHYTPKQYFQDNDISFDTPQPQPKAYQHRPVAVQQKPISIIPFDLFIASLKGYDENHFVQFLINLFGVEVASQMVRRYFIGTSKHWNGAAVFWQIDIQGKVRTGKIMLYSPTTGKRIKEPFNHINWVHSLLKQPDFALSQCLFGEHLLIDKIKPVAIVESEKTAVIASVYLPQFIWLAVGSLNNLNAEKCSVLQGRSVTLFPDLNGFEKWSSKAKELSHLADFTVSDLLERKASEAERKKGYDLADYLLRFDVKEFATAEQPAQEVQFKHEAKQIKQPEANRQYHASHNQKAATWESEISELEKYFAGIALPAEPIKLNQCSTITDCSLFIESHLATIKANKSERIFMPFYDRLKALQFYFQTT